MRCPILCIKCPKGKGSVHQFSTCCSPLQTPGYNSENPGDDGHDTRFAVRTPEMRAVYPPPVAFFFYPSSRLRMDFGKAAEGICAKPFAVSERDREKDP